MCESGGGNDNMSYYRSSSGLDIQAALLATRDVDCFRRELLD